MSSEFKIIHASWTQHQAEIRQIRREVFIEEQQVPPHLEWEGSEENYHCILATDNNDQPIATGRIDSDGHIGRMAVLKEWRQKGIGRAILNALLEFAQKQHCPRVYLHAQTYAIPFYEKQGFIICSDEFMDAGIPHKTMEKIF